jgi:hypothetical protein
MCVMLMAVYGREEKRGIDDSRMNSASPSERRAMQLPPMLLLMLMPLKTAKAKTWKKGRRRGAMS